MRRQLTASDYYTWGKEQEQKFHPAEAIRHYKTALKLNPNFALAHNALGVIHYNKGELEQALVHFNAAVTCEPCTGRFRFNRGMVYYAQNKHQEALNDFNKVISSDPLCCDDVYYLRAKIYQEGGNKIQAIRDCNSTLMIKSFHAKAAALLTSLLKAMTDNDANQFMKEELYHFIKALPPKDQIYFWDQGLNEETPLGRRFHKQEGAYPCDFKSGYLNKILERRAKLDRAPVPVVVVSLFKPLKNNDLMSNRLDDAYDEKNHGFGL